MFSSLGLFSHVPCPDGNKCHLLQCLFLHSPDESQGDENIRPVRPLDAIPYEPTITRTDDGASVKRRRLEKPKEVADTLRKEELKLSRQGRQDRPRTTFRAPTMALDSNGLENLEEETSAKPMAHENNQRDWQLKSSKKEVSPPPLTRDRPQALSSNGRDTPHGNELDAVTSKPKWHNRMAGFKVQESLNPRIVPRAPAKYDFRLTAVQKMHAQHVRLNNEHVEAGGSQHSKITLNQLDLVKLALEEEEKYALENATVYNNVIKNRIVSLMKMDLDTWREYILESMPWLVPAEPVRPRSKTLGTGLTQAQQLAILPRLQAQASSMDVVGYVRTRPTEEDIDSAKRGVETSEGWEVCERCKSRFQVFPGRRAEDGILATGGPCRYHWGKLFAPKRDAIQKAAGHSERTYTCCNETVGTSSGCTKAESHVFKISDVKRLASVLQFERTPDNNKVKDGMAVCIDCEMGFTVHGLELIRLTATSWPSGDEMIDVLVRPMGEVLDLNSRFSGVMPVDLVNAIPFESGTTNDTSLPNNIALRKVPSPAAARDLLFSHINPTTFILGHALENDLNSLRLIHPCIVDTAFLFPHPRPLPVRNSLKFLMSRFLDKAIQLSDVGQGHDSKEDARAAGELVSWKINEEWKILRRLDWTFDHEQLVPPNTEDNVVRRYFQNFQNR